MSLHPHTRNSLVAIMLLLALSGTVNAQGSGTGAGAKSPDKGSANAQPKVSIAQTEFNFGEVKQGEMISHTFTVKNTGAANLEIKDVRPGCGCTASDFDKVILPGQEGKVTLKVNTAGFHGSLSKFADVTTSDPVNPNFTLTLVMVIRKPDETPEGQKVGPFVVGPSARWQGRLTQGGSTDVMFTVINTTPQPVKLTKILAGSEAFTTKLQTLEEGKRYLITATSSAALKAGPLAETIKVATDSSEYPELKLQIETNVDPAVVAMPKALNFGMLPISNPEYDASRTGKFIFVRLARGSGLEITKASSTLPFLKIEVNEDVKGQSFRLLVTFDKDKLTKGEYKGKITLELNNALVPVIDIPVTVAAQ